MFNVLTLNLRFGKVLAAIPYAVSELAFWNVFGKDWKPLNSSPSQLETVDSDTSRFVMWVCSNKPGHNLSRTINTFVETVCVYKIRSPCCNRSLQDAVSTRRRTQLWDTQTPVDRQYTLQKVRVCIIETNDFKIWMLVMSTHWVIGCLSWVFLLILNENLFIKHKNLLMVWKNLEKTCPS